MKYLIGLLLCLPLVWSYLQPHFFHLHDFTHVARLAELERGILEGQFPVRWSQNLGFGYGMPQFSFYGPLFYFEALLFRAVGIDYVWAIKLTVILQVVISYIALYKLGELLWGKWGGLTTAIAGIYAPYRLVDMYVRGAFAELSGMTFVALVFYLIVLWAKKPTLKKAILVVFSGAGIILSHTLMALISAPFVILWFGFWTVKEKRFYRFWRHLFIIGFLSFGLTAFFTLPALLEKGFTQADQLTSGFSNYNFHFLYIRQLWNSHWGYGGSIWGLDDDVTFELGKVQIIAMILGLVFVIKKKNTPAITLYSLLGISLFLCVLKSKFIWDMIPFMSFIQFPWRFLSVAIIFVALLVGSLVSFIPKRYQTVSSLLLIFLIISTQFFRLRPEAFLENDTLLYYSDTQSIQSKMSEIIPDFLPKSATPEKLPIRVMSSKRFVFNPEVTETIEVNRGHEFLIAVSSLQPSLFTAQIFDFPGWELYFNGQKLPHTVSPEGLIQAQLPTTTQSSFLSGRFEETPLRLAADIITAISTILVIALWVKKDGEFKNGN